MHTLNLRQEKTQASPRARGCAVERGAGEKKLPFQIRFAKEATIR
jgi:hypothetical protein